MFYTLLTTLFNCLWTEDNSWSCAEGIWVHSYRIPDFSCSTVPGCCLILLVMMLHTFSIGDRCGLQAGQSSTHTLRVWSHAAGSRAEWSLASSCWNNHGPPGKRRHLDVSICFCVNGSFTHMKSCYRNLCTPMPSQTLAFALLTDNSLDDLSYLCPKHIFWLVCPVFLSVWDEPVTRQLSRQLGSISVQSWSTTSSPCKTDSGYVSECRSRLCRVTIVFHGTHKPMWEHSSRQHKGFSCDAALGARWRSCSFWAFMHWDFLRLIQCFHRSMLCRYWETEVLDCKMRWSIEKYVAISCDAASVLLLMTSPRIQDVKIQRAATLD